jgi:ACS family hexuronate transporter-like MFS transporter
LPLQKELGWTESQYGLIIAGFQATYALGMFTAGPLIDRVGTRIGYAAMMVVCSLAAVAHGLVRTVTGFGLVRLLLGLGEAGNFPSAVKAISEWFPAEERAFAAALFNSGSTVGAILAPLMVPWIAINYGWRPAFILVGALGFLWIPIWLAVYRRPLPIYSNVDIGPGQVEAPVSVRELLRHRATWVFFVGRFITEPVWWFYLYWAPKFLSSSRGFTLRNVGLPLMLMYAMANVGGIFGGWFSSFLLKRGWSVPNARKAAVLASALMVVPVAFDSHIGNMYLAIGILGLAMAGHQSWASNLYAMLADIFPRRAVATVTGLTGTGAAVGGIFFAAITGFVLHHTGSYQPILTWASFSYMAVLVGMQVFLPKLERIRIA